MIFFLALIFIPIIYFVVLEAAKEGTKKALQEFNQNKE